MSWIEKGQPTPFDNKSIQGLWMLDGDALARFYSRDWTEGQMLPMVAFPSGQEFEVWNTSRTEALAIVHLAGEMDLPYAGDDRDSAFELAFDIAEQCGYAVFKEEEEGLEVWVPANHDRLLIKYDNQERRMIDVVRRGWHD